MKSKSQDFGWQVLTSTGLFVVLTIFAAINASKFDETEIRMILEVMGAFGVVQFGIARARTKSCDKHDCPLRPETDR